jgi:hypothetical protein
MLKKYVSFFSIEIKKAIFEKQSKMTRDVLKKNIFLSQEDINKRSGEEKIEQERTRSNTKDKNAKTNWDWVGIVSNGETMIMQLGDL